MKFKNFYLLIIFFFTCLPSEVISHSGSRRYCADDPKTFRLSKDLLFLSEKLTKFKASKITISIFAIILYFTFKEIQMYCLDFELTQDYGKTSN